MKGREGKEPTSGRGLAVCVSRWRLRVSLETLPSPPLPSPPPPPPLNPLPAASTCLLPGAFPPHPHSKWFSSLVKYVGIQNCFEGKSKLIIRRKMGIKERSFGKGLTLRRDVIRPFSTHYTFFEFKMERQCVFMLHNCISRYKWIWLQNEILESGYYTNQSSSNPVLKHHMVSQNAGSRKLLRSPLQDSCGTSAGNTGQGSLPGLGLGQPSWKTGWQKQRLTGGDFSYKRM